MALFSLSAFLVLNRARVYRELDRNIALASEGKSPPENSELHRLREYVLLGSTLGQMFSTLRGTPMSTTERSGFLNLSIFAPLFDDLFDQPESAEDRLLLLIEDHRRFIPDTFSERLLSQALEQIYAGISDKKSFQFHFQNVYQAQKESQLQALETSLSQPEIRRITLEKGGHSALLYRTLLNNDPKPKEEDAFFKLGGLIQLMDDIFDTHADLQAGVQTLATSAADVGVLASEFESLMEQVWSAFWALGYSKENTGRFLSQVLVLSSRGQVCLEQFLTLQRSRENRFQPEMLSANELLCDMETPRNFLKSMSYCLSYPISRIHQGDLTLPVSDTRKVSA